VKRQPALLMPLGQSLVIMHRRADPEPSDQPQATSLSLAQS
jgi:hypothetical protein